MRVLIILFSVSIFLSSKAQTTVDGSFIFKTHLFLEKVNVVNIKGGAKGGELFSFFIKNINLQLDTLHSIGFHENFLFLSLSPSNGVSYNYSNLKSDSSFFLFIDHDCSNYVLVVNKSNGMSYRLKGFRGNDFISLYSDIKEYNKKLNYKKLGIRKFTRDYYVDGVDFACLYSAVKSKGYDSKRYPCLKNCDAKTVVIH